jgi:hypothetical protein
MNEIPEQPIHGWRFDLNEPPKVTSEDAALALTRVAEEIENLRGRTPRPRDQERASAALRAAASLGATEHELAVATGLPLEHVRTLLGML